MHKKQKKVIGIVGLFSVMFFLGWQVAKWKQASVNTMGILQTEAENWGLGFGAAGTQPTGTVSAEELQQYDAYYVGDKDEMVLYLTFDCG